MSEYITLTSNDSKLFYPENKMSNFKVKLSKRLDLDSDWEVALVRFSFTHSLCNFSKTEEIYIIDRQTKERMVTLYLAPQRITDTAHLIRIIKKLLEDEVNISDRDFMPHLGLDDLNRVFLTNGTIGLKRTRLDFSPGLRLLLGLDREGFHYMDANKTDLYIYADVVSHRVVGDTMAPLLTSVDIGNLKMVPGQQTIVKIKNPAYYKVAHTAIDEIEVQLLEDTGREPQFDFGVVTVTLHFKKP